MFSKYDHTSAQSNFASSIEPNIIVLSTGGQVAISNLAVRYWFSSDTPTGAVTFSFSAIPGQGNQLSHTFGTVVSTTGHGSQNRYLSITFNGPAVIHSGQQLQLSASVPASPNYFYQDDDYSFGHQSTYMTWPNITVYQSGTLIYGTEP